MLRDKELKKADTVLWGRKGTGRVPSAGRDISHLPEWKKSVWWEHVEAGGDGADEKRIGVNSGPTYVSLTVLASSPEQWARRH